MKKLITIFSGVLLVSALLFASSGAVAAESSDPGNPVNSETNNEVQALFDPGNPV